MDALTEAVIYTVLMVLGGFCAGHWLTLARYERRYKAGIRWQLTREARIAEMDAEDAFATDVAIAARNQAIIATYGGIYPMGFGGTNESVRSDNPFGAGAFAEPMPQDAFDNGAQFDELARRAGV